MRADHLMRAAQEAIDRLGADALIALVIPGCQTRTTRRRLWKAGPMAECTEVLDRKLVVQIRAADLITALRREGVVQVDAEVPEGWQPK